MILVDEYVSDDGETVSYHKNGPNADIPFVVCTQLRGGQVRSFNQYLLQTEAETVFNSRRPEGPTQRPIDTQP